jgi:hypothetical protein
VVFAATDLQTFIKNKKSFLWKFVMK